MADRGYALDMSSPVRYVATKLDRAAGAALSVSDLAADYNHGIGGDRERVKRHNGLSTDHEANAWIVDEAIKTLSRYLHIEEVDGERRVRFANGVTLSSVRYDRRKIAPDDHDPFAELGDPFNPMSGWAVETIRAPIAESDTTKAEIDADAELRSSFRHFGWIPQFPAILDERGVVLVGRRRVRIARELGIEPRIEVMKFGRGDSADAARMKLVLASNAGVLPLSKIDRRHLAQLLFGQDAFSLERAADKLRAWQTTEEIKPTKRITSTGQSTRPKPRNKRNERNERIIALAAAGMTSKQIAAKFGIVSRAIDRVLEVERVRKEGIEEGRRLVALEHSLKNV